MLGRGVNQVSAMYPRPASPHSPFKKNPNQNILYQVHKEGDLVRSCLPHHYAAGSANPFNTRLLASCADSQNLLSRDKDSTIYRGQERAAGVHPRPWRLHQTGIGGLCVCHPRTDNLGCAHTWPVAHNTQVRHIPEHTVVSINKKEYFFCFVSGIILNTMRRLLRNVQKGTFNKKWSSGLESHTQD